MMKASARVRRDGSESQIPVEQVVVGDVVLLAAGDEVPADGRIIAASALQIDESALNQARRERQPASALTLACNAAAPTAIPESPPIRRSASAVDLLVAQGGTAILSETPEIYGAEHLLTRRAVSREVGEKLIERIHWWETVHRPARRRVEQQSLARQQGRGLDHDPGKVSRRSGQGRHAAT